MIPPRTKGLLIFAFLTAIFITLLVLPADFFDDGPPLCISVLLLNQECYGCGMTRGIMHILHGDFQEAFQYNKLSFLVLPLFIFMILWELDKRYFNIFIKDKSE